MRKPRKWSCMELRGDKLEILGDGGWVAVGIKTSYGKTAGAIITPAEARRAAKALINVADYGEYIRERKAK